MHPFYLPDTLTKLEPQLELTVGSLQRSVERVQEALSSAAPLPICDDWYRTTCYIVSLLGEMHLLQEIANREDTRLSQPLVQQIDTAGKQWPELYAAHSQVLLSDFDSSFKARVLGEIEKHWSFTDFGWDTWQEIELFFAERLDAFELMVIGAEQFLREDWHHADQYTAATRRLNEFVVSDFWPRVMAGTAPIYDAKSLGAASAAQSKYLRIDYLPQRFWWRHLPVVDS